MPRIVQPGNHVSVGRGLFDHHGIYMGWRSGIPVVAELAKPSEGGAVRLAPWSAFSRGGAVRVVDHSNGLPPRAVVDNVLRTPCWRTYSLLDWNCEHFATWCSTYEARSAQVDGLTWAAATLAALWCVSQLGG